MSECFSKRQAISFSQSYLSFVRFVVIVKIVVMWAGCSDCGHGVEEAIDDAVGKHMTVSECFSKRQAIPFSQSYLSFVRFVVRRYVGHM